jgi:predicted amidophosphoribosyltransferase
VIYLWICQYCGHENDEILTICDNCGASRNDDIGDSGDNKDSEDLFFDDEGI